MKKTTFLFIIFILIGYYAIPVMAQRDNAIIPDFQVNENSLISSVWQYGPSISADGSGNFIITWSDARPSNLDVDVYAQRYSSDGTVLGNNFKVSDDTVSAGQGLPDISVDGSGNFIIVWQDGRNGDVDIYAQRYASNGTALGNNFKVSDDTGSAGQNFPSISADDSGNFIITWSDARNGGGDLYAQRYASDGTAVGSNFQVNDVQGSAGSTMQFGPSISADDSGNFIITWEDQRNGDPDIYAQRYSSDGTALGSNFKINDDTGNAGQSSPSISADGSGNFVITWSDGRNGDGDVYAQRYASDGTVVGSNFKVNDNTGSTGQNFPSISADDSGNFIITWEDERNGDYDIYAQRYASDGTALGSNFRVNDDTGNAWQIDPSISADDSGNFIITWDDERNVNGIGDIYAQRYSNDGTALGSNFKVNDDLTATNQFWPSISVDDSGNFIITWEDERNTNWDIYAQRYSSNGTALDSNFQVNDDQGSTEQRYPSISGDDSGNFVIAWQDERNGNWDIYAQRYASDGTALGSNFQINDVQGSVVKDDDTPSISADNSGNFIISWTDNRNGDNDIYAQRCSSDGTALGNNFKVNDDTGNAWQGDPSISADGSGNFVITWFDDRNGDRDLYAQRYLSDGTVVGSNFQVTDNQASISLHHWSYPSISTDGSGNFIITWCDGRNNNIWDIYAQRYLSDGTALGSNFRVNDDTGNAWQRGPSISADDSGNFIISWQDLRVGNEDIYAQRYSSDGTVLGSNFRVTNTGVGGQASPDVKLWNGRIYNTWTDDRAGGTGADIWANVLDWYDPVPAIDKDLLQVPAAFVLHQNYPNPFNPSTTIEFNLPKSSEVTLKIFNILGEEVATLVSDRLSGGSYSYEWDASILASGVYLYKLQAGDYVETKKMILMR